MKNKLGRKKLKVELDVYLNQELVGHLIKDTNGAHYFHYNKTWLNNDKALPISYSLPLREAAFRGQEVYSYFENLLPDNVDIRKKIAAKVSAESIEPADLLSKIGRDCVGALQFILNGEPAPRLNAVQSNPLSESKIANIIKNLGRAPFGMDEDSDDFRISIAGAHEKTALLRVGKDWHLPKGSTPTSHIFKPPIGKLADGINLTTSVENEWLCLKLCDRLGLKVPKAEIKTFEDQKVLIVERFDRKKIDDQQALLRIPIEDLCQALGIASAQKYEKDGGPGISDVMNFLDGSNNRIEDKHQFMRAQIVFFLLNATDGHGKNFSIELSNNGYGLCPIYDVLSLSPSLVNRQIEVKQATLAMGVGKSKKRKIREILKRHFEQSASMAGLEINYLKQTIESLDVQISKLKEDPIELPKDFPTSLYEAVLTGIEERSKTFKDK